MSNYPLTTVSFVGLRHKRTVAVQLCCHLSLVHFDAECVLHFTLQYVM